LTTLLFFVGIAAKSTCAEWYYLAASGAFPASTLAANYRISMKKIREVEAQRR
jgi:hypothetical protein